MPTSHWEEDAACFEHPYLDPEAWGTFYGSTPVREGAKAWVVCVFACPVRAECAANFRGSEIIAGGGWFTKDGRFIQPDPGYIDVHRAAAYLGISAEKARLWGQKMLPVYKIRGRIYFKTEDIIDLGRRPGFGPLHGTSAALQLHELRGERLCLPCRTLEGVIKQLELTPAV